MSNRNLSKGDVLKVSFGVMFGIALYKIIVSIVKDIIFPIMSISTSNIDIGTLKKVLKFAMVDENNEVLENEIAIQYGEFFTHLLCFIIILIFVFIFCKLIKKPNVQEINYNDKQYKDNGNTQEDANFINEIQGILRQTTEPTKGKRGRKPKLETLLKRALEEKSRKNMEDVGNDLSQDQREIVRNENIIVDDFDDDEKNK